MTEPDEPHELEDIDRELEKLRGFGSTFFLALGAAGLLIVVVTVVLWLLVF